MMKMNMFKKALLFCFAGLSLSACSEDDNQFAGVDNSVMAFTLTANNMTYKAYISENEIVMSVPEGTSLEGANATVKLCENAAITPDPATITSWNEEYEFTVKAYNQAARTYDYKLVYTPVTQVGNMVLRTQADVDAFAESGITVVEGNLVVGANGTDTIIDLSGLSKLKEVTYTLSISANYAGKDLAGLGKLQKVGGLNVVTNKKFKEVSLPALEHVGMGISIVNPSTRKIVLPLLAYVGENVSIACDSLMNLEVSSLEHVVGGLTLKGLSGYSGSNQMSMIEFPVLKNVGGKLDVENWAKLDQMLFPELASCGEFYLYNTPMVSSINLPELLNCVGKITLMSAVNAKKISFSRLAKAGSLEIRLCEQVEEVDFSSLKEVEGALDLQKLLIVNLKGFRSLETVGDKLNLENMANLETLGDISALKKVKTWQLYNLPKIPEINVKGREIETLSVMGSTLLKARIVGDREFKGILDINDASNANVLGMPVFEGIQVLGGFKISAQKMPVFEWPGITEITGQLNFSSLNGVTKISMPDLQKVGTLTFEYVNKVETVALPMLATVTGDVNWNVSSSAMTKMELPALVTVGGNMQLTATPVSEIKMPSLTSIGGELKFAGSNWSKNTVLTNLDGFAALASVKKVTIAYYSALVSFAGLKNVIAGLETGQWSVTNCGYNPTLGDMQAGKFVKE